VLVFLGDLASPTLRVAPLEIVPIVSIALLAGERIAFYAALLLTALGMTIGHLAGTRPLNAVSLANGVINVISYAAVLVIVRQARGIAERMVTLAREAADAKRVHDALFPRTLEPPGAWQIDVVHLPLRGIGGDFFQVRRIDGETAVFLADVSGKGIQAAMLLAALKTVFDAASALRTDAAAALGAFNRSLCGLAMHEMFATAWLGVLSDDGAVRYASAGHEPVLVRTADGAVRTLEGGGLPLGVENDPAVRERRAQLHPGETLVAYSDGLTQLLDAGLLRAEELFERFAEVTQRLPALERRDDVLALRMTYRGPVESTAARSAQKWSSIQSSGLPDAPAARRERFAFFTSVLSMSRKPIRTVT